MKFHCIMPRSATHTFNTCKRGTGPTIENTERSCGGHEKHQTAQTTKSRVRAHQETFKVDTNKCYPPRMRHPDNCRMSWNGMNRRPIPWKG